MIKATVRYGDNHTTIHFPCKESQLQVYIRDHLKPADPTDMNLFVSDVYFPEELKVLENRFVDLDELNYLGRRLAGFFGDEQPRFAEAVKLESVTTVREMINIACDVYRYALITDLSTPRAVGHDYVLQTQGCLVGDYKNDPKYTVIGRDLMQSGRGVMTERGMLFVNTERPLEKQYTGSTFPAYLDDPNCFMIAEISYQGQTEYVNLPAEKLALDKALRRLGASDVSACTITIDHMNSPRSVFRDLCDRTLQNDGIYTLNHWSQVINRFVSPERRMVFDAAFTASGLDTILDAAKIAECLDAFFYAGGVKNEADLGKWWLEHISQFTVSPELEMFFDYQAYGEKICEDLDVYYLENGDCIFLDGTTMDELLGIEPTEDMGMGGIQ